MGDRVTVPKATSCTHANRRISVDLDRSVGPGTPRNSAIGAPLRRLEIPQNASGLRDSHPATQYNICQEL